LLKVLRLETPSGPDAMLQGIAASSNLSMNQTLEGHNGSVMCVTWNPVCRKLTTSDETGLIIVWMLHKGMWYEEMINNRNKSVVRDMKWTNDGKKIAIVYEDGAVIVGSVDGTRLWGKDLSYPLRFVEWSPDGKLILFVTFEAEVFIFDADGNKIRQFPLIGQDPTSLGGDAMITSLHWYCPTSLASYHVTSSSSSKGSEKLSSTLCIAFENGKIQLSRGDDETTSELIETDLITVDHVRWSTKGQILAVVGTQRNFTRNSSSERAGGGESKSSSSSNTNIVKFFDATGRFIRSLKIPGENIKEVSWEGGDLRLSLAVDSFIYFANIRHRYLWTYFSNTVVYAYPRSDGRREHAVVFWDLTTQESFTKFIPNLKFLVSSDDICAVVVTERTQLSSATKRETAASREKEDEKNDRGENKDNKKESTVPSSKEFNDCYVVQIRNSIGAVLDIKQLTFIPKYVTMSSTTFVAVNDRTVYTWQFNSSLSSRTIAANALEDEATDSNTDRGGNDNGGGRRRSSVSTGGTGGGMGKQRIFDLSTIGIANAISPEIFKVITEEIPDPITSVAISDKYLLIGRKNGVLNRFNLPHLTLENTYQLRDREPFQMSFNCTSNKLAMIDINGYFTMYDLEAKVPDLSKQEEGKGGEESKLSASFSSVKNSAQLSPSNPSSGSSFDQYIGDQYGKKLPVDRKDVWDLCWAEDDPDMIVIMEKTKMVVFQNEVAEEPIVSSAYLGRFKDLEVRLVALDSLMQTPDKVNKDFIIDFETKRLREVREKISMEGLQAAYDYADVNTHPRLWKLLAVSALEDLELSLAEKSFVRCNDYYGIQFVKTLEAMPDKMKARAEVAVYLHRFDESESILREIDRKDLAIQLRKRLGDYTRVVQLLQTGGGNDRLIRDAWDQIGYYFADRMKWKKASQYFALSHNNIQLIECFYRLEQFNDLKKMIDDLPEESPLLVVLAKRFECVGMINEAVEAYLKGGNNFAKEAIDCCVKCNKWDKALELAEKYDFPQVEGLLIKYAMDLVSSDRKLEAIELFRAANKPTEAAILISDLAENVITHMANPSLAKKLHVLSALEIERHRKRAVEQATKATMNDGGAGTGGNIAQATAMTLESLMMTSLLDGGPTNANTVGGTLQMTLNTLANATQGGNTTVNTKKISRAFANAWRGAAAYHYYMLALRQFYSGSFDAAMKTSIKLCEYDDILQPRIIYSLLCLTSLKNKFYGVCSKAFVKVSYLLFLCSLFFILSPAFPLAGNAAAII
jgi:WD repeat-containing protein 35